MGLAVAHTRADEEICHRTVIVNFGLSGFIYEAITYYIMQFFQTFFLFSLHLVYNLTNNFDVENTKLRMEQYQRENRDIIQRNKAKLVYMTFLHSFYVH